MRDGLSKGKEKVTGHQIKMTEKGRKAEKRSDPNGAKLSI
jgi:hypothetical protein